MDFLSPFGGFALILLGRYHICDIFPSVYGAAYLSRKRPSFLDAVFKMASSFFTLLQSPLAFGNA